MTGGIKITQTRSSIRHPKKQRETLRALGLGKIGRSVEKQVKPEIVGMLKVVEHLVSIERTSGEV